MYPSVELCEHLENKYSISVGEEIGTGSFGAAFSTSEDSKVLKLTTDPEEYNISRTLMEHPLKGFIKVYAVEQFNYNELFVIKERVFPLSPEQKKQLERILRAANEAVGYDMGVYDEEYIKEFENYDLTRQFGRSAQEYLGIIRQYEDVLPELDLHEDNFGISAGFGHTKRGKLVMFDP